MPIPHVWISSFSDHLSSLRQTACISSTQIPSQVHLKLSSQLVEVGYRSAMYTNYVSKQYTSKTLKMAAGYSFNKLTWASIHILGVQSNLHGVRQ